MTDLLIVAASDFGPLSVDVVSADGKRGDRQAVMLSSAQPQATLRDLSPGAYAVVATRPTGETLVERVTIGNATGRVEFRARTGSPHDFLQQAAMRGYLSASPFSGNETAATDGMHERGTTAVAGTSQRAMVALASHRRPLSWLTSLPPLAELDADAVPVGQSAGSAAPKRFTLCHWTFKKGHWQQTDKDVNPIVRPNFLQVGIDGAGKFMAEAVGLVDDDGFGPIVIAPMFQQGLDITFLADGLMEMDAAERVNNPSAVRVPVAVAMPRDPALADLLAGLTAASLPGAQALWAQETEARFGSADNALDMLLNKSEDPIAAVLAAHFLTRFSPTLAPIAWLENLARLLPGVSDAATLLAWRLITDGSSDTRATSRREIRKILLEANRRPCCLFARNRALLTQALRLYGPKMRARSPETLKRNRHPRAGDFLDVGADAGGLEAFWGSGPLQPGRAPRAVKVQTGLIVHLDKGSFSEPG